MKKYFSFSLLFFCFFSHAAFSTVCNVKAKITRLIPSTGDAGLQLSATISGCSCDHEMVWIDTNTDSGKILFSSALAAKTTDVTVLATVEDGKGQGTSGNNSITYR